MTQCLPIATCVRVLQSNGSPLFEPNQLIEIRSADEILASLDDNGALDGLPIMPGMLDYCGAVCRVYNQADKICATNGPTAIRSMSDAWYLDIPPCQGHSWVACDAGCRFIWKTAWIKPAIESEQATALNGRTYDWGQTQDQSASEIIRRFEANCQGDRYVCQATELWSATQPLGMLQWQQYWTDWKRHGVPIRTLMYGLWFALATKAMRLIGRKTSVAGKCTTTPVMSLNLKVGDVVRVKNRADIESTLNSAGKNRGLWFDPEMLVYCDKEMQVSRIVTQLIDETTGNVVQLREPTIVLEENRCTGCLHRFCQRQSLFYWREIWVDPVATATCPSPHVRPSLTHIS